MQSRKSTKALLRTAIAAREKVFIKLEGFAEGGDRSYTVLVSETAGEPRRRGRSRRCKQNVWQRSTAMGPSLMFLLLPAPSGLLDLRRRSQRTFGSSWRSGTPSSILEARGLQRRHSKWILSRRRRSRQRQRNPTSVLPKLLLPRSGLPLKSQEQPPGAEPMSNAAARPLPEGELLERACSRGRRVRTADPEEPASEVCTMADFSQPEIWNRFEDGRRLSPMAVQLAHN